MKSNLLKITIGSVALMTLAQCFVDGDYEVYDAGLGKEGQTSATILPGQTVVVDPAQSVLVDPAQGVTFDTGL